MELSVGKNNVSEKWSKILLMVLLFLSVVFTIISFTVISTYYPIVGLQRNISHSTIGLVFAAFQLGVLFCGPFLTTLANYTGIKYAYICSMLMCSVSALLFSFMEIFHSNTPYIIVSVVFRLFQGAGFFGVQSLSIAVAADMFPDDLSTAVSVIEIANGIGFASGPPIGGIFYQLFGFKAPTLFVSSVIFLMFLVITLSTSKNKEKIRNETDKNLLQSYLKILQNPKMYVGLLNVATFTMSYVFFDISLSPYLKTEFGFQQYKIGLFFTIYSIVYSITGPFVGFIVDRYEAPTEVMALGSLFLSTSYFILGPMVELQLISPALWTLILSFLLTGMGFSCMYIPTMAFFLQAIGGKSVEVDTKTKSLLSSCLLYGGGIGGFLGPTIGGMMLQKMSFTKTCFFFSGINFLLFIILTFTILIQRIFGRNKDMDELQLLNTNSNNK